MGRQYKGKVGTKFILQQVKRAQRGGWGRDVLFVWAGAR